MGAGLVQHQRDPGALAAGAEHVGLPGGSIRGGRHRQATAKGGEEVCEEVA